MRYLPILWLILLPSLASAADLEARTEFAQRVELSSSLSGRIDKVMVKAGQRVTNGQILLTLFTTGLQAAVNRATAEVDALRPLLARVETELEKAQELYARDSLAQVELQRAEQDYAIANARLAAAEAELVNAAYLLSQADIRAPIDGMVIEMNAQPGVYVNTRVENRALLVIADIDTMLASVFLPAREASDSLLGQQASVRYEGQRFSGRVIEIGRQASLREDGMAVVPVRIAFKTGGKLSAGVPVTVNLAGD